MSIQVSRRAFLTATAGIAAAAAFPARGFAAGYPSRDISYIIPYNPGGMSDNFSRILAEQITKKTGVNVINDYRPGAGGAIGANYYVQVKPDGYTILQSTNSFYAIIPQVTKVEYDPKKDFTPLVLLGDAPMVIAVNPSVPAKTLQELISYAKKNPGKLAYGTAGKGTVGHMCGVWLSAKAGIELVHIPYKGTPAAMQACLSNEVQMMFGPESAEHILVGKLTGLALMGDKRWDNLPNLPTTVESGIPGWAPRSWHTVTMLSKTLDDIIKSFAAMLNEFLQMPDVKKRVAAVGVIPGIEDLAGMRKRADDDFEGFGKIIREAGLAQQG